MLFCMFLSTTHTFLTYTLYTLHTASPTLLCYSFIFAFFLLTLLLPSLPFHALYLARSRARIHLYDNGMTRMKTLPLRHMQRWRSQLPPPTPPPYLPT